MSPASADDRAQTIVVLAKEPLPGRVKTRLQSEFTPEQAAGLAACAIEDTLHAVRGSRASRKVIAWDGNPVPWNLEFEVVEQSEGDLNERLSAAFDAVLGDDHAGAVLLIGMDTPQVTARLLDTEWGGADAVLGLSEDGGFWAIGLRGGDPRDVFDGIPMSTDRTGAAQWPDSTPLGCRSSCCRRSGTWTWRRTRSTCPFATRGWRSPGDIGSW